MCKGANAGIVLGLCVSALGQALDARQWAAAALFTLMMVTVEVYELRAMKREDAAQMKLIELLGELGADLVKLKKVAKEQDDG